MSVLDNPAWWALCGSQRGLGTVSGRVGRFDPAVSPFGAIPADPTPEDWGDLVGIVGPGGQLALIEEHEGAVRPGSGWSVTWELAGVQMIWGGAEPGPTPRFGAGDGQSDTATGLSPLGAEDVEEMLALVELAQPGPFVARTVEFGGYLGVRSGGRLIAMAGERLRPPGFAEISAVATDPAHRRQGLGERLVRSVAAGILARDETPFLHAAATNVNAIRLYESIGFTVRRQVAFAVVRAPGGDPEPVG
jgi:ribosomal protein S18 acetylase RimI-like enzyme